MFIRELKKLNRNLKYTELKLKKSKRKLNQAQKKLKIKQKKITKIQTQYNKEYKIFIKRLEEVYKNQSLGFIKFLFTPKDFLL